MDEALIGQAKTFILSDIKRELARADASEKLLGKIFLRPGGSISRGWELRGGSIFARVYRVCRRLKMNDFSDGNSRKNFDEFFADLGAGYKQLLTQHKIYKIFRCGLAHEYYVKKDCTIYMRSSKPLTAGIGHDGKNFFFVVEKYYEDFKIAFEALCTKLV